jgi:hypothetical protein
MSLINVDGQIDQNAAAQLAAQLAQIIQAAPNTPEKANFIRDLAAQLGVSTPAQDEDNNDDDENRVDYRDEHEYDCYNDVHDDIEHRGKLVFIDDRVWDVDLASNIFNGDPSDFGACDFEDIAGGCSSLDIDEAIDNVDDVIEKMKAVKQTLENCKDNGSKYVIWNNDNDFDYETGNPEDI